jgi:predicted 2-oxoglutarate/Fe(II)-dependent dioxygenase YbiX
MDITAQLKQARGRGAAALGALAKSLLSADAPSRDITLGLACLNEAAEAGDGASLLLRATMTAGGVLGEPNWEASFDMVRTAAERGDKTAQSMMRLLSGGDGGNWGAMRTKIDVRPWLQPPQMLRLNKEPQIGLARNFLTPAQCAWFIEQGRPRLTPALVYRAEAAAGAPASERTNREAPFGLFNADVVTCLLQARLQIAIGISAVQFEPLTLLHYKPGQEFKPHVDFLDGAKPGHAEDLRLRGQRVVTALVYLNDDFDGGETDFPELQLRHKPSRGDALVFTNVTLQGSPDPKTRHAGLAPTRGEKWVLSQWVRDRLQGW